MFLSTPCLNFFPSASGLGTLTNWHQTSCHSMQLVSLFVCLCHCLCVIVCFIVDASVSDWHQTSCSSMQLSGDVDEYDPHCKYHTMVIILIFSSVRSSNSHPDLLVSHHFFRSHQSSILDFHFLSHYSYIKSNHWPHLLATCIPKVQDSAR